MKLNKLSLKLKGPLCTTNTGAIENIAITNRCKKSHGQGGGDIKEILMRIMFTGLLISFCFLNQVKAQSSADILERGKVIKKDYKLFFFYEDGKLKYWLGKSLEDLTNAASFKPLKDSLILLSSEESINVFIRPVNPLNYSTTTAINQIVDPVNEAAAAALNSIIGTLGTAIPKLGKPGAAGTKAATAAKATQQKCEDDFNRHKNEILAIKADVEKDQKKNIAERFNDLAKLDFIDATNTGTDIAEIKKKVQQIGSDFKLLEIKIEDKKKEVLTYSCKGYEDYLVHFTFTQLLIELSKVTAENKKRYENLVAVLELVENSYKKSLSGNGISGLKWSQKLADIVLEDGKIAVYNVKLFGKSQKLSDKEEIISVTPIEVLSRSVRVRRFQRFVPEVAVGTVYTFFKYKDYGTVTDDAGQQYVGEPKERKLNNFNVAALLNFNYFIPNSALHPFYQLGAGVNSGIPTLLTGFGLRSNLNGLRRIAISGGLAMSWIKTLQTLKVGDKVSGTADIEKDIKYEFSWPPKPYIGIQYSF